MAFDPVILPGIYPKQRVKDTDHSILKKEKKKRTEMLQKRKMLYDWTSMTAL